MACPNSSTSFLAAFDDVANNPDDLAARAQLVEQGKTLLAGFTQLDAALATQRQSSVEELGSLVDEVNEAAARVAELNQNISSAINNGFSPNELMDQRDLLIAQMAEQVGVSPSARARTAPSTSSSVGPPSSGARTFPPAPRGRHRSRRRRST